MVHPYAENLIDDAMQNLGEAVDYAVNHCGVNIDNFFSMFVTSGYANSFEKGNANLLIGLTGPELATAVLNSKGLSVLMTSEVIDYSYSAEYWCGWILALYQWEKNISFRKIINKVSASEILSRYHPLHEASEERAIRAIDKIIKSRMCPSPLQKRRKALGLSQSEFARAAEVNLRTLQQYEAGNRSLAKASYETLHNMASVLGCEIEDLVN